MGKKKKESIVLHLSIETAMQPIPEGVEPWKRKKGRFRSFPLKKRKHPSGINNKSRAETRKGGRKKTNHLQHLSEKRRGKRKEGTCLAT